MLQVKKKGCTWCRGRPTMEGKTARGASSPANPALHIPDPLSITRAAISSSIFCRKKNQKLSIYHWTVLFQGLDAGCRCGVVSSLKMQGFETKGVSSPSDHGHIRQKWEQPHRQQQTGPETTPCPKQVRMTPTDGHPLQTSLPIFFALSTSHHCHKCLIVFQNYSFKPVK